MVQKPKIALIGYGYWGKIILPYLEERFEVARVFGRSVLRQGRFTNNLQEIWGSDVVAVVVATSIDAHYEVVLDALRAGKHVLCEKPLALLPWQAEKLQDEAALRQLHLIVDFTYTFSQGLQMAAGMFSEGAIGELNYIELNLMRQVTMDRREGFTLLELFAAKFAHLLSILGMFVDLKEWIFAPVSRLPGDVGLIRCRKDGVGDNTAGQLRVSTAYPAKHMSVMLIGTKGKMKYCMETDPALHITSFVSRKPLSAVPPVREYSIKDEYNYHSNEADNLIHTVEYLRKVLERDDFSQDNVSLAVEVTRILADTCDLEKEAKRKANGLT